MKTCLKVTALFVFLNFGLLHVCAQPTYSVVPANAATGVSPTASVVFTFSEPMDMAATVAQFFDTTGSFPSVQSSWSGGATILTCTPSPPWVSGHSYVWTISGQSVLGDPLDTDFGSFTVGNSGGGGSGTNKTTTFTVGKVHAFDQTSTAAAVLDLLAPYTFTATTGLASNRTANLVTLTLPTSAVSNLNQNPIRSEEFYLFTSYTNLTSFDTTFPVGNYQFYVSATASNQQVTVNLPASLTQPNAPHISNFSAAQSINSTQAFSLNWDAFVGGTANDFVSLSIGSVYTSPTYGSIGALNGTSTSFNIPANSLQPNSNYDCSIGFYHVLQTSNSSYVTVTFVGTTTAFTLNTSAGVSSPPLVLTNFLRTSTSFSFDVQCSIGQTLTVESSTSLLPGTWTSLSTTTSPGTSVHISDPRAVTNRTLFYRARNGN